MTLEEMEFTKASSKGQIVIPRKIRKKLGIQEGSMFSVSAREGIIILKKLNSKFTKEDLKTIRLVEEAWDDIEHGRYKVSSTDKFLEELRNW
jgi:AbrB family looped-hinge helix DNA binding protein